MTADHLRLSPSVLLSPAEDGYIAYDTHRDRLYRLNATAALIVELCDGTRDRRQLEAALSPVIGAGWQGCADWMDGALGDQLLVADDDGGGAAPPEPRGAATLARQAEALQRRDRVLAAYICQQRATALDPDTPAHWLRLGELAHITGRRDAARDAYQRYLDSCPDDAEVTHLVIALNDGTPPSRVSDRCLEQLYSRFAAFYDENMVDELSYCAPERLYDGINGHLEGRDTLDVLDLGCGTGLSGATWRHRARRLVGIDLSADMVERARQRGIYDALERSEITAWLAQATCGPFHLIVACDSLIYFGDLAQVVVPAARHLGPSGLLAFTVERGERHPFRLSDSGRFTHHPDHVSAVVAAAGLTLLSLTESIVRYEYGEAVTGLVAVCQALDGRSPSGDGSIRGS